MQPDHSRYTRPVLMRTLARTSSLLVLLVSCSPQGAVQALDAAASDAQRVDGRTGRDVDARPSTPCSAPPERRPPNSTCVRSVRGRVTDLTGAPLAGRFITFCGPVCFFGETGMDGSFDLQPGDFLDPALYGVNVHGRPEYAPLYVALAGPVSAAGGLVVAEPIALPRYAEPGPEMPDPTVGGTVTAGDVTVTIPRGAQVEYDLEDVSLESLGRRLRVAPIPMDRLPAFAREATLAALWALGPLNFASSLPMPVRLRNVAALPAGASVELLSLETDFLAHPETAGRAVLVARGTVTPDGAFVETAPGEGLRRLTWVGYRPARAR